MSRRVLLLSMVGALTLTLSGMVAFASIPDSGGVVHGCFSTATVGGVHVLGVIDTATTPTCPNKTTPLSWSQTGPPGPAGPQGQQGPAGPQGATGAPGPAGISGYEQVTRSLHFDPSAGGATLAGPVFCPAGKRAVTAGLVSIASDQAWFDAQASDPGGLGSDPRVNAGGPQVTTITSSYFQGNHGLRNPVLPTSGQTADGTGWVLPLTIQFPTFNNTSYGITVSVWLACEIVS